MADQGIFNAGERLGEPVGDISRSAVAALRGFSYQLHASALAWIGLREGELLYLEVAEDFAIVTRDALRGTQVKDDAGSGSLTIRSAGVIAAIDSLVDLTRRNAGRRVSIRYLTTAAIGRERASVDRIDDGPALSYWRRAANGENVGPLRDILLRLPLQSDTLEFIRTGSDQALRSDLLSRVHWEAGQPPLGELEDDLKAGMIEFANSDLRLPAEVGRRLASEAVTFVLKITTTAGAQRLRRADLIELGESIGRVSLPASTIETLLSGAQVSPPAVRTSLLMAGEPPNPGIPAAERAALVASIAIQLAKTSFGVVTGSTGMGKTHAAERAAATRGRWMVVDFRDLPPELATSRLLSILGGLASVEAGTILLDDLDTIDHKSVRQSVARVISAAKRRDIAVIATCARSPAATSMQLLCGEPTSAIEVPYLLIEEVAEIVQQAGGDRGLARLVHLAGSGGHPQLVQATILHMRDASWSRGAVRALLGGEVLDVEEERRAARDRFVAALPEQARTLLLRASVVLGRFSRSLALALSEVDPRVPNPGLELDRLVGPWIERPTRDSLRVSPLVGKAGSEALSPREQVQVHRTIADHLLRSGSISVTEGDMVLHHALAGGDDAQILGYAQTLVSADADTLELLARHSPLIATLDTETPLAPGRPMQSALLRLGQLMVTLSGSDQERARTVWLAMKRELTDSNLAGFESVVLSKILITTRISDVIPEWVDLVIRFDELCLDDQRLKAVTQDVAAAARHTSGDLSGFAFLRQAMRLGSPRELRSTLERLDAATTGNQRKRLLSAFTEEIGHFGHLVDTAWMSRSAANDFDGEVAAEDYMAMAELAERWGERALSARCHAARAVMLDEVVGSPKRALESLVEADRRLGPTPAVSRARAKVHWRSRDHVTALRELEAVWSDGQSAGDPLELGFVAREAAISAAETGRWAAASTWFDRARETFPSVEFGSLPALRIGLRADAAQASYLAGDHAAAIAGYSRTLEELKDLDPASSLSAAYCHRVVRHAVLWLMTRLRPTPVEVEVSDLPPGACSNPDPSEEILKRPLGPIDIAWYLLADASMAMGLPGLGRDLHSRLIDGPIAGLEITRRKHLADLALTLGDSGEVARAIIPYASGSAYLAVERDKMLSGDLLHPVRGDLPQTLLDGTEAEPARKAAIDLLLAHGMLAGFAGREAAPGELRSSVADHPALRRLLKIMGGAEGEIRDLPDNVARSIADLRAGEMVDPTITIVATIRFCLWASQSEFRGILAPCLGEWTIQTWLRLLDTQRFRLIDPQINEPEIRKALHEPRAPLALVASVALAAASATKATLSFNVRSALLDLRSG